MNSPVKFLRGHYDINGDDFFFRSKWEANYALYLNFLIKQGQIKSWEYEPQIFYFLKIKRGTRSYTPDFKVWVSGAIYEWHEVKGYMDAASNTKLKRMALYYPAEHIKLIQRPLYNEILKKLRGIINFY